MPTGRFFRRQAVAGHTSAARLAGAEGGAGFRHDLRSGSDTLRVDSGNANLTTFGGTITGIETIDLEADLGANTVTLVAQDVLDISDTDTLTVLGDAGDSIDAGTGWTDGGFDGGGNPIYTQMVGASLATLVVDLDVAVNADILM